MAAGHRVAAHRVLDGHEHAGTLTQIDALLQGADTGSALTFTDALDAPVASTQLTVTVNDNGNTGTGGALSAQTTSIIATTRPSSWRIAIRLAFRA